MHPFDAYRLYVAIKVHFSNYEYDAKAAKGRGIRVTEASFAKRRDQKFFNRAARDYAKPNAWVHACVAGHVAFDPWIGHLVGGDTPIVQSYQARRERLTYQYEQDLSWLLQQRLPLDQVFRNPCHGGQPLVLRAVVAKKITPESAVLMNRTLGWIENVNTSDTMLWPEWKLMLTKYQTFVPFKAERIQAITNICMEEARPGQTI
jgi:hypothetical protein